MPEQDTQNIEDRIDDVKSVLVDGVRVEDHSLGDRVAAERFLKEQAAAADPFGAIGHRQLRTTGVR